MKTSRLCGSCNQVRSRCFCNYLTLIDNVPKVLILQHPSEVKHAKNTAGFLSKCLKNSQIIVGEIFSETFLHDTLKSRGLNPLLLYPPTQDPKSLGIIDAPTAPDTIDPEQTLLVVIDATWRKSRKMLYLNRELQTLPRLSLNNAPTSLYRIRKADSEIQLSTLEATCYALAQIAPDSNITPVISAFSRYIDHLATFYPHAAPSQPDIEDL